MQQMLTGLEARSEINELLERFRRARTARENRQIAEEKRRRRATLLQATKRSDVNSTRPTTIEQLFHSEHVPEADDRSLNLDRTLYSAEGQNILSFPPPVTHYMYCHEPLRKDIYLAPEVPEYVVRSKQAKANIKTYDKIEEVLYFNEDHYEYIAPEPLSHDPFGELPKSMTHVRSLLGRLLKISFPLTLLAAIAGILTFVTPLYEVSIGLLAVSFVVLLCLSAWVMKVPEEKDLKKSYVLLILLIAEAGLYVLMLVALYYAFSCAGVGIKSASGQTVYNPNPNLGEMRYAAPLFSITKTQAFLDWENVAEGIRKYHKLDVVTLDSVTYLGFQRELPALPKGINIERARAMAGVYNEQKLFCPYTTLPSMFSVRWEVPCERCIEPGDRMLNIKKPELLDTEFAQNLTEQERNLHLGRMYDSCYYMTIYTSMAMAKNQSVLVWTGAMIVAAAAGLATVILFPFIIFFTFKLYTLTHREGLVLKGKHLVKYRHSLLPSTTSEGQNKDRMKESNDDHYEDM